MSKKLKDIPKFNGPYFNKNLYYFRNLPAINCISHSKNYQVSIFFLSVLSRFLVVQGNNRNTRLLCGICSKSTIKTPKQDH